jgi:hypothetical protein
MPVLVFVSPRGFRDESFNAVKLFLSKWGIGFKVVSYTTHDCVGTHGAIVKSDVHGTKVAVQDYSGLIIVDGEGIEGFKLYEYRPMLDMVLNFNNARKPIIAIGNAIKVPSRANIIKDRKVSITNDAEANRLLMLFHGVPSKEPFEIASNLVTIGDPNRISEAMPKVLDMINFG